MIATKVVGEGLEVAIELVKKVVAYTKRSEKKNDPKKDPKKGSVAVVMGDQATTSGGKNQAEVNVLLEMKKKEWQRNGT